MNVGETYRISGRKDTYLGDIEIRDSEVLKHEYYYPLDINVRYVDEGNVWDELRYENNYRLVNIESATVEKVLSSYMYINLGGMEVRVNCKYADISAIYSGSIVSLKGVIQYYNGELRLVTSEVYYSQQYGNVRIDYNGDGNVDNWEYVTFGTWLYSAASMFTDREFLHWEEVYYDDYGYETVNVISFDSYLSYNVYRNDVLLRAVYKETNNDTYFASLNSNSYDSINIYDQSSKNVELKDFTVAVDSSGKIIYASKTSTGYGGPADGFYHDGNYICEPGKICGIFSLDYRFAGWPNTTYIDGQLVNAWTLYDVVVPYGGYIITGSEEQMTPLLQEIDPQFYSSGIFFEMVNDGSYNDNIRITAEIYGTYGLIGVKKGSYSGSTGEMYFELGENSYDYKHVDGVVVSGDCDIVENGNILHLYNCEKVYSSSYDAQGNSCLKLGTASIVGKFSFDVSENVNYVIINVAAYKNYDCIIEINGVQYEITTFSNDGAYTEIKIDTTYVKTISFSTVNVDGKKTTRCMINSIVLSN